MTLEQILAILKVLDQAGVDEWVKEKIQGWMKRDGATDAQIEQARAILAASPEEWLGPRPTPPQPEPEPEPQPPDTTVDLLLGVPFTADWSWLVHRLTRKHQLFRKIDGLSIQYFVIRTDTGPWTIPPGFVEISVATQAEGPTWG